MWPMFNKISHELNQASDFSHTDFNKLLKSTIDQPIRIESKHLMLLGSNKNLPFYCKLKLPVLCSRIIQKQVALRNKLLASSTQRGEAALRKNTNMSLKDRKSFVVQANANNKSNFLTRKCNSGLSYKGLQNVISARSNRINTSSHN